MNEKTDCPPSLIDQKKSDGFVLTWEIFQTLNHVFLITIVTLKSNTFVFYIEIWNKSIGSKGFVNSSKNRKYVHEIARKQRKKEERKIEYI